MEKSSEISRSLEDILRGTYWRRKTNTVSAYTTVGGGGPVSSRRAQQTMDHGKGRTLQTHSRCIYNVDGGSGGSS